MKDKQCTHCGLMFSIKGIGSHVWRKHTEEGKLHCKKRINYFLKSNGEHCNKGKTKENDSGIRRGSEKLHLKYESGEIVNAFKGRHHTEEVKKQISQSMKLAQKEGRAHNIGFKRWKKEPSYPESFFMKAVENEFEDKEYIYDMQFGHFKLDFAWPHKKKCIEIDSEIHLWSENVARDKRKDDLLEERGWQVLRLWWPDMYKEPKKHIKEAKDFIG